MWRPYYHHIILIIAHMLCFVNMFCIKSLVLQIEVLEKSYFQV